jgi:hypothetical protein
MTGGGGEEAGGTVGAIGAGATGEAVNGGGDEAGGTVGAIGSGSTDGMVAGFASGGADALGGAGDGAEAAEGGFDSASRAGVARVGFG